MHMVRRYLAVVLLGLVAFSPVLAQTPLKDTIKTISYTELGKEIRAMRGKVVVVYFWSFT